MLNKIDLVLRRIERLESQWEYQLSEQEHKQKCFARTNRKNMIVKFYSVPKTTGQLLKFLVLCTKSKKVLELGCSAGYSTIWMASGLEKNDGVIYTTEILEPKIKIAEKNFNDSGLEKRITLYKKDIIDVLGNWKNGKIDMAFIDADKEKYYDYYDLLFPLVKNSGLIVADDVGLHGELMRPFIMKVQKDKRVEYTFLNIDHGLILIYKK